MKRKSLKSALLGAAVCGAIALVGMPVAHATPVITITLQEAGYANYVTQSPAPGGPYYNGSFGTFTINKIGSSGDLLPADNFSTNSINTSTSAGGTLYVYASETGITSPTGIQSFLSGFTLNQPSGALSSVTETTYYDASNALNGMATQLGTATFLGLSSGIQNSAPVAVNLSSTNPYSITEVFKIIADGKGSDNATITMQVPEPGSLALMGTGLLGLAAILRRKRRRA
ncbi:PEP-CTERM sorting domain-containing protein [Acidiphilium acidophilum]|uniref:PEP-CTERM sorting domain-containing protein n=1 Tax=Acidiphilium acidophilum TaxID=76588 RepID=A0AAW9DK57_ACIAO|nr:PEP-CTERM sorting domain-containing protein [Acidiphilium acidophilum]MDX5929336.1 PEP-CTERM sorting domain-containing protein [Acidiphilium acidophilum]